MPSVCALSVALLLSLVRLSRGVLFLGMLQKATRSFRVLGLLSAIISLASANAATLQSGSSPDAKTPFQSTASPDVGVRPQNAESSLMEFAKQHPESFAAQQSVGEFYLQQDRLSDGIPYLEKAQRIKPDDYDTGYDLSLAYLKSGNLPKAVEQLQAMIKQHETAELDGLLAEAFEKSGDYKNAAITYDHAAVLDPSEDNVFDLGSFLLQHPHYEGFLDKALVVFRYGVQQYPRSAKLTVGLGVTLYADGKYDDAVQTLCSAVDLDPSDPKPYQFLGKLSKASPALMPMIQDRLESFVRRYPENGPANYYYAMILWKQSNGGTAENRQTIEALLKKAISGDPQLYDAHFQLGVLYQDENKYADAIAEFNQTLKLQPDYNRAHYHLVLLYNRTHQKELADEQLTILKQIKKQDAKSEANP
jgi:tetratricopeptide (TPR) repeat protein